MTADFYDALQTVQMRIPALRCRVVPSSFDASDARLSGMPQPKAEWTSFARFLALTGSQGVITRLPPFWQAMSPMHAACRARGVPMFFNDIANMPVGARALKEGGMDSVVTESADAVQFAAFCADKGASPRAWFVIHRAPDTEWPPLKPAHDERMVAHEVHVFPGVAVLEQCDALMTEHRPRFHLVQSYHWTLKPSSAHITSVEDEPLPFRDFELPFALQSAGMCSCGQDSFSKHA